MAAGEVELSNSRAPSAAGLGPGWIDISQQRKFGLVLNVSVKDLHCGDVASDPTNEPGKQAASFTAQVIVLDNPAHSERIQIATGYLLKKIDRRMNKSLEKNPQFIRSGDCCVKLVPSRPMCIEAYNEYASLG
ncbi:hypothetical protein C8R43DRAFT_952683 [Mycena crocata]|nr:hypothetical protein C8R43DRAFT_952683 [Mycena crocata]